VAKPPVSRESALRKAKSPGTLSQPKSSAKSNAARLRRGLRPKESPLPEPVVDPDTVYYLGRGGYTLDPLDRNEENGRDG
jgi:hypothetical protein